MHPSAAELRLKLSNLPSFQEESLNKKLLIAVVGATLVAAPMLAVQAVQAAPTVYGSLHISLDNYDVDQTNTSREIGVLNNNSSRFGLKGDEDLGGGLKAIWQMESGIFNVDSGTSGLGNTLRNTFVGFSDSAWGLVKLGRHDSPMKDLGRSIELFNEQVGDARNITGLRANNTTNIFDTRVSNMIRYESLNMGGIKAALQYSIPEGTPANLRQTSLNVTWTGGPMYAGFGYETHGLGTKVNGTDNEKIYRLVGKYSMDDLTFGALYEQSSDLNGKSGDDRSAWGLGAGFKMANNMLKAQYYSVDQSDKNAAAANGSKDNSGKLWALGVDHTFSKTTLVYFAYAVAENGDGSTGINPSSANGGHGTDGPAVSKLGGDGTVYSFGTIMKF